MNPDCDRRASSARAGSPCHEATLSTRSQTLRRTGFEQVRLRNVFQINFAGDNLAIAELTNDFEDLGPGGVHALVELLIHLDGHDKLELLGGHLTLFGGTPVVRESAARASPSLKARIPTVVVDPTFGAVITRLHRGQLTSVEPRAAIHLALAAVLALPS